MLRMNSLSMISFNKSPVIFFGLFCALLLSIGCGNEPTVPLELGIEDALFARADSAGNWATINDSIFIRGDDISLVLLNVSGLEPGDDSLCLFDIDIEVTGPGDRPIFAQRGLLGDNGHMLLPDGTVEFPCGTYTTMPEMELGAYNMKLTIYDKISGKRISRSRRFFLNK